MPRYERILPLVGIVVMGLGLILLVERIHTLTFAISLPGESEAIVSIAWLILLFLLIVAAVGTESLQRVEEDADLAALTSRRRVRLHPASWILPVLLTLATFLFLSRLRSVVARAVGLVVAGGLLLGALLAQHYRYDGRPEVRARTRLILDILVYANAFLLYASIYVLRMRSLFSATAILLLTFLLAYMLLERLASRGQVLLYAGIVGLCLGEITWALNYWPPRGVLAGAFLLSIFYAVVNLAREHLRGALTRGTVLEYVVLGLVGMVVSAIFSFWPR